MKKLIYLLPMMFIINTSYGSIDSVITETKQTVKETINTVDTSSTFKQIYSDVKEGITGLASALKVGAEHVYGVLVKQQIVNSIVYIILTIVMIWMLFSWVKAYKTDEKWLNESFKNDGPTMLGVLRFLQVCAGLIIFTIVIFNVDVIVMGIVNPEYGAIMEIIKFAK